ncbi:hypothetical protein [Cupriavidus pauculus]|uniref:hypothetical protein n=1 Tax=Cupriavidus pauculus TaxID=82633 RepID=UPI0038573AB5
MLTAHQLDKLERLYAARTRMVPLPLKCRGLQDRAEQWQIFQLQRHSEDQYYLIPTAHGRPRVPRVHAFYIFVILQDDPGRVYCGLAGGLPSQIEFEVEGHTSLSMRTPVLYAGTIRFNQGRLVSWTNGSGHYRPPASLAAVNLIPAVERLLPKEKFQNILGPMQPRS